MDKSLLVKIFGHKATLIHDDTTVLDRWLWLKSRLPETKNQEKLIDIGCGNGSFTIGASLRGYNSLGLSWDDSNQEIANLRAKICNVKNANFEILDVRALDSRKDLSDQFDVAVCLENIEHIINDQKLIDDITTCLKPGGKLLLTTPNYHLIPITDDDDGPFLEIEDGRHVRRGYTSEMIKELCENANLELKEITFCSGFVSQKITKMYRLICPVSQLLAWAIITPLRILPLIFDPIISKVYKYPSLSICFEAHKAVE